MEELAISTLLSDWGSAAVVVIATGYAVVHQYKEMNRLRDKTQELQSEHTQTIQELQREHTRALSEVQQYRVHDAKAVTQTLMALQVQFDESVHAMSKQLGEHSRLVEQVHQTVGNLDRRVELMERKGSR